MTHTKEKAVYKMISAKLAREQAQENEIKLLKGKIETLIKKAISNGRTKVTLTGQIPACIVEELEQNGFHVQNGMIKW